MYIQDTISHFCLIRLNMKRCHHIFKSHWSDSLWFHAVLQKILDCHYRQEFWANLWIYLIYFNTEYFSLKFFHLNHAFEEWVEACDCDAVNLFHLAILEFPDIGIYWLISVNIRLFIAQNWAAGCLDKIQEPLINSSMEHVEGLCWSLKCALNSFPLLQEVTILRGIY